MSDSVQMTNWNRRVRAARTRALRLLDLQLWCLGRDVAQANNLLLQFGFTRRRADKPEQGGSEYAWTTPNGHVLTAWGYGVHLAHPKEGGLFLKRFTFAPRWTPPGYVPHGCWHVQAWKRVRPPRTPAEADTIQQRIAELATYFAAYERWITAHTNPTYRQQVVAQWHKQAIVPADQLATAWMDITAQFASSDYSSSTDHTVRHPISNSITHVPLTACA